VTQNPSFINRHKIIDIETNENYIKDIEFNFIELPKFKKQENELESIIDQWVYFIKNAENLLVIPENLKDKGLKFAYEDADKHNWSKEELEAYDYVLMREQDEKGRLSLAIKKEKEQNQTAFAKSLFRTTMSNIEIAEHTQLPIAQIIKLRLEI
jgi:PD-(D/E)XK nuclease family transposase